MKKTMLLKELLPMIRLSGYDHRDESGTNIILAPEVEEWTHVSFNLNSGLLDVLGDLRVESIDAEDGNIKLWLVTEDYNQFSQKESET